MDRSSAGARFLAELRRRDARSPRLDPGESVVIDYDVRPGPSDLVLVVEADGVPRVVRRWRVPPAAWVVGVVRMLDPTVVRL